MIFALLTLLAALAVAAVTEWFSVVGIMAIYAGAPMHAALIMGLVLGGAKLVNISWLYRNWQHASWKLKAPLIYFTIALMIASSIGVYGFLTKSHLEQSASTIDNSAKVERLDQQIAREKSVIADNEKVIAQLDTAVNSYFGKDNADKALAVRRGQAPQRKQLRNEIVAAQIQIDGFSEEKLKLTSQVRAMQLEVGPIKYIADLFYGSGGDDATKIESAVIIFTLLIVSTLDPLAVILLIAANHTLLRLRDEKQKKAAAKNKIIEESKMVSTPGGNVAEDVEIKGKTFTNKVFIIHPSEVQEDTSVVVQNSSDHLSAMDEQVLEQDDKQGTVDEEKEVAEVNVDEVKELDVILRDDIPQSTEPVTAIQAQVRSIDVQTNTGMPLWQKDFVIDEEEILTLEKDELDTLAIINEPNGKGVEETLSLKVEDDTAASTTSADTQIPEVQIRKPWSASEGALNEIIVHHTHFIPRKLNEEKNQKFLETGTKDSISTTNINSVDVEPSTQANTPEIQEMAKSRSEQIQEEILKDGSNAGNLEIAIAAAEADKYPKALSWLTEFKGI